MPRTIATNTRLDRAGLTDFLRPRHRMILMTNRSDGRPQLSPVSCGLDEAGTAGGVDVPGAGQGGEPAP